MGKRITVVVERCMGCHTCEIACAIEHSESRDLDTIVLSGERPGYRINVEAVGERPVPVSCQHCDEAACLLACPTGAITRLSAGAPVLVDRDRCIGCTMCVQACPFGMMSMGPDGKGALKCDLCVRRQAEHQEPACVASCPTKALRFEEHESANRNKRLVTAQRMTAALEAGEAEK